MRTLVWVALFVCVLLSTTSAAAQQRPTEPAAPSVETSAREEVSRYVYCDCSGENASVRVEPEAGGEAAGEAAGEAVNRTHILRVYCICGDRNDRSDDRWSVGVWLTLFGCGAAFVVMAAGVVVVVRRFYPPQQGAAATISPKREQVMSVEVPGPMRLPNGMNGNFDSIYTACTEITVALPQEQPNFTSQPLSSRRKAYTGRPRGPAAPTGHSEFGKQHGTG